MKVPASAWLALAGLVAAGGVLLYIKKKGLSGVAAGVVGAVGDAATGSVLGIGDVLGIPRTNQTECEKAKAEGRWWDASFACPAGDFISSAAGNAVSALNPYSWFESTGERPAYSATQAQPTIAAPGEYRSNYVTKTPDAPLFGVPTFDWLKL